jgi:hypothetical protein
MQITPPSPSLVSPLAVPTTGPEKNGRPDRNPADESNAANLGKTTQAGQSAQSGQAAQSSSAPATTQGDSAASAVSENISISEASRTAISGRMPAPVYAEIWKGDIKVAQIDIHGQVQSFSGLVASGGGASLAGPIQAAQRAIQVARMTGGEIRSAGQSLDSQTLLMRAKLANTYIV